MKIVRNENITHLKFKSKQLVDSMLSPLCGMNQEIGYVSRTQSDMNLMVGSAALTGIHVLFNRPNPGRGAYHIGGTGIFPNESMIRILGESIERYAQLMAEFSFSEKLKYARYEDLVRDGENVLPMRHLCLYSNEQLSQFGFPFNKFVEDRPLSWLKMISCFDQTTVWIPAQMVLVGYNIKTDAGEPWITSAVTTGTASHINYLLAFKAALLELIQLDTVMGHWYSSWSAYKIELDSRVSALNSLLKRYGSNSLHRYLFYYIPNPDLIGFTIACVYLQDKGLPKVVIGLGADVLLEDAMYKALLETVASVGLARMVLFKGTYEMDQHASPINPNALYDLDRNVEYYGAGNNSERIAERFLRMPQVKASSLPKDMICNQSTQLSALINSYRDTDKKLYYVDLTGIEEKRLGFKVVRVWSPDTLSLCLPSAPQVIHPRYTDFGGIKHADPHPYP